MQPQFCEKHQLISKLWFMIVLFVSFDFGDGRKVGLLVIGL